MSDKETILSMLDRAGITPDEVTHDHVMVERGYIGFVTYFLFDEYGNLKDVRAEE